ncbi:Fungal-trans domain-containing protein [Mycena sanguinolenta]|uniref:Fungal-trans domain-containing protein n=1 Tax=Mycena sanguinolenta TaxID=230812 RepID=A0A8H6XQF6_9AGAR|nr:Fungal-trans domain-containing protein [Mycena sanguinolenta]
MHDALEPQSNTPKKEKRKRLQGSCDSCRKRKSASCFCSMSVDSIAINFDHLYQPNVGDSAEMRDNRCTNCITSRIECTHVRGKACPVEISRTPYTNSPMTAQEYVAAILSTTTVYVPSHDPEVSHRILVVVAQYARILEEKVAVLQVQISAPTITSQNASMPTADSGDNLEATRTSGDAQNDAYNHVPMRDISTNLTTSNAENDRFHGLSSSVQLIKTAIHHMNGNTSYVVGVRRPEFWSTQPWEKLTIEVENYIFPEDDLLDALITIYFEQINPILGILHFPSFNQSISDGLHLRHSEFAALVLAVCSLASRHSDDPRVFMDDSSSTHSCGWKWFRQIRPFGSTFLPEPSLYRLQLVCLSAMYTNGISIPEESWMLAGLGLRLAHAAGAHHPDRYRNMEPLTAELHRRVFWVLVISDTLMSSFNGRPAITNPDEFEIKLPVSGDAEYWGIPNAVQSNGKPSLGAFTPVYLQLFLILARIQRAVTVDNVTERMNSSSLNAWLDTVPDHRKAQILDAIILLISELVRWDPHQQNQIFLDQSAALYSTYYHAQILMHRPFIPTPNEESLRNTHFPSLAICANAARACGHVLDVQARRGRGPLHYPALIVMKLSEITFHTHIGQVALFDSAVVLLFNVWAVSGGRKAQTPDHLSRATADAEKCVRVLRLYERRWRIAGRQCDIINAMLKHASDVQRRVKETTFTSLDVPDGIPDSSEESVFASSSSVAHQLLVSHDPIQEMDHLFALPLLTEELGRLPIYNSFHYEPTFQPDELYHQAQPHYEQGPVGSELFYGLDPALASMFSAGPAGVEDIEMPFEMPYHYGWHEWSTYFTNIDQAN